MASLMINGARYAIATAMAAAVVTTGATNASPPVIATTTPPTQGAIILFNSGWNEVNEVPAKVGNVVAATSFQLLGYDATDVTRFPAGEGAGAFIVASSFVNLPKIHDIQSSGGEPEFATRQYISDSSGKRTQTPTGKSAQSRTFQLDYQPDLPHFDALITLDRKGQLVILRETLRNGDTIYYAGYLSFNKEPTRAPNEFMSNVMTLSLSADSVRYAA